MTREQIKQNAIAYANKAAPITGQNKGIPLAIHTAAEVAYINGAHSRDEEIKELKEEIESLKENEKELFEGFKKRGTKLGELMKENVKLRNPWISVEDRLPEKGDFVFVRFIGLVGYTAMHVNDLNKEKRFLGYSGYKCTHWMPIPELPKGE